MNVLLAHLYARFVNILHMTIKGCHTPRVCYIAKVCRRSRISTDVCLTALPLGYV